MARGESDDKGKTGVLARDPFARLAGAATGAGGSEPGAKADTKRAAKKVGEKPARKPAEKPAEKPAKKAAEKPAKKAAEKPAKKPAEKNEKEAGQAGRKTGRKAGRKPARGNGGPNAGTAQAKAVRQRTERPGARRRLRARPPRTKRRRLTDPIVITGIAGNLGQLITKQLHTAHSIIGIDQRRFRNKPKDVIHHRIDARRRKAEDIFRANPVRALIHLGFVHRISPDQGDFREWNTLGTIKLLEYCQRYGVDKVVLLSTAQVYGARPNNSNFLTEDAPLTGQRGYPEMRALIEWDMYAQSFFWKHPDIETVILRPVHVVGPNVRNAPSNYLRLRFPPTMLGFDPMVQLVHEDDLIRAILLALEPGRRGVFNITGPGAVPLSRVLEELDRDPIPVPHPLAELIYPRLWKLGLSGFPPGELPHLRYQCLVDGQRAEQVLGYQPQHSMRDTIRAVEQ